jgi:hypothetical protein
VIGPAQDEKRGAADAHDPEDAPDGSARKAKRRDVPPQKTTVPANCPSAVVDIGG